MSSTSIFLIVGLIVNSPTKAKSREPAYSPALVQNKIDRQQVKSRESGKGMSIKYVTFEGKESEKV